MLFRSSLSAFWYVSCGVSSSPLDFLDFREPLGVDVDARRAVMTMRASLAKGRMVSDAFFEWGSSSEKMSFRIGAVRADKSGCAREYELA